eukprot:IDg20087t1
MTPDPAFVAALPLQTTRRQHGCTVHPSRTFTLRRTSRSAPMIMNAEQLDFDEIARRLAGELKDISSRAPVAESDAALDKGSDASGHATIGKGNNDMPKVTLRHIASNQTAEIYAYGACVTSWATNGIDHLWMSDTNKWEDGGKAIRGGIPLCFPQFG